MKKEDLARVSIGSILYLFIGSIILLYLDKGMNTIYANEYIILSISYFIVGGIFAWITIKYKLDIFQPFILISIIYICMFTITPIVFIIEGKTDVHGIDVMGGCIKATIIYTLSYIAFTIGYINYKIKINKNNVDNVLTEEKRKNIVKLSVFIWAVSYAFTLMHLFSTGKNIVQILTIGNMGVDNISNSASLVKFLSNFSFCMIIPWMYICFLSKNKILKIVITYLILTAYIIRGFRYIIVIMIGALIITYYRKRKRVPSTLMTIIGVVVLLLFIGALGYMRDSIRTATDVNWSKFGIENITYALESNFDIYKTFYGIVETYPEEYSYTYGRAIFGETIMMFVPRILWPNKPLAVDASVVLAIKRSVSEFAISNAAMATPNIGEFYVDFGTMGCIIFMLILGIIAKSITKFYFMENDNINHIILYSVITPTFLQLIIRGYTPSNFYLVIFLLMPYYIINSFLKLKF